MSLIKQHSLVESNKNCGCLKCKNKKKPKQCYVKEKVCQKPLLLVEALCEDQVKTKPVNHVLNVNQIINPCVERNPIPEYDEPKKDCCNNRNVLFRHTFISAIQNASGTVVPIPTVDGTLSTTTLVNWQIDLPIISAQLFNPDTGIITVPESGVYDIKLVVNFLTSVPLTGLNAGLTNIPYLSVYDTTTGANLVSALFPTVSIPIPATTTTVSSVLTSGEVIIIKWLSLVGGQTIAFRVVTNGLASVVPATISLHPPNGTTTFTFQKLRDPVITYNQI